MMGLGKCCCCNADVSNLIFPWLELKPASTMAFGIYDRETGVIHHKYRDRWTQGLCCCMCYGAKCQGSGWLNEFLLQINIISIFCYFICLPRVKHAWCVMLLLLCSSVFPASRSLSVWQKAAIIPCCKGDPKMSSNGDLQAIGSSDSFWEVRSLFFFSRTHYLYIIIFYVKST